MRVAPAADEGQQVTTGSVRRGNLQGATRKRAVRRSIGRPASATAAVGRDTLIGAACDLLKTTPPSAITRAALARQTGVDPSLIRYYFKNRDALLIAAAEHLTQEFGKNLDEALKKVNDTPEGKLIARIGTLVDLIADYPYFHRLIVEEILPSNNALARELINQLTRRAASGYAQLLEDGARQKRFRPIDPDLFFGAVIGMCEFQVTARELRSIALGRAIDPAAGKEEYKAFIVDLLINGIAVPQRPARASAR